MTGAGTRSASRPAPRVLVATGYARPSGAWQVTVDLVRVLRREGFVLQWAVLRPQVSSGLAELERAVGVPVVPGPSPLPGERLLPPQLGRARRRRWYRALLRRFDPALIYCVTLDEELILLNRGTERPCVEHVHAIHLDGFSRGHGFLARLGSFADLYLCTSRETADRLCWCAGVPPERVRVAYNGIDVAAVQESAQASTSDLAVGSGRLPERFWSGRWGGSTTPRARPLPPCRGSSPSGRPDRASFRLDRRSRGPCQPDLARRDPTCRSAGSSGSGVLRGLHSTRGATARGARPGRDPVASREPAPGHAGGDGAGTTGGGFSGRGSPRGARRAGGVLTMGCDPDELGAAIASLADDRERRARLGVEGRRLVEAKFDAAELLPAIARLLRTRLETGVFGP